MKLIIAGGRCFNDYALLKKWVDFFLRKNTEPIEIVSGTADGADKLGEKYANENNYSIKQFPADWTLGKKAWYLRNKQMAEYASHCICFWDGKSKGTKMMIDLCKEKNLNYRVINY